MDNLETGFLLNADNIKMQREYFKQMCEALGIKVLLRTVKPECDRYNMYGEMDKNFNVPEGVWCIYDEHPNQKSMKKLGWNTEVADTNIVIHVPYDVPVSAGCVFIIPSGLDGAEGRVFKVLRMSNIAVYPISIACELGPVLVNDNQRSEVADFKHTNFNLLADESEEYGY